jgi:hypothetical protein
MSVKEAEPEFLGEFKDLVVKYSARRVVQEHLISGLCRTMDERSYYELRSEISSEWHLHPNEIIIVGSGKLGFSIKRERRFKAFRQTSDYDIAIVCSDLFDYFWRLAFRFTSKYYLWKRENEFHSYMVRGWMRPDLLPSESFDDRVRWDAFFDDLSTRTKYGRHRMKAGLYKSWEHLEAYQTICVDECKTALARS